MQQVVHRWNLCTRFAEKGGKDRHLQQQRNTGNNADAKRVYQSFGNHRAKRLAKRYLIVFRQHAATRYLAHTRQHQIGGIRQEDSIYAIAAFRMLVQRFQRLLPPPTAEDVTKHAKHQRQHHPPPMHLPKQHIAHLRKVEIAIHPIEDKTS